MADDRRPPDPAMARRQVLADIRAALGRARTPPRPATPPPDVDAAVARLTGPDEDLVGLFAERAAAAGMAVRRVDATDVADAVIDALRRHEARQVLVAMADAGPLVERLGATGFRVVEGRDPGPLDGQFDLDAGITDVHCAIAETGTIVCHTDDAHGRGPSLVPPLHIAIVRAGDVLADLIDYWERLGAGPTSALPSSAALISGPSKTADIEGVLIAGVHGPKVVEVLVVA